jgi:APA family basic amino acid/polyamine antiporter
VAGAVAAVAGCLCYAELGINFPKSGGEYIYLREAWGPVWGFLSGWISFFAGFSAPIATGALGFSEYLAYFSPSLAPGTASGARGFIAWNSPGRWLAVGIVCLFAVVNIVGLKLAARLQNFLTAVKLAVLLAFLALAFAVGHGSAAHFSQYAVRTSPHGLAAQFAVSLVFVMFAYSGWNAATYVAEEMKTPERTLPAALVAGTLAVAALYVALNAAFIYALPLESMKGVIRIGAASANALFGNFGGGIFSAVMSVGLLSCVSAMVIVGPRVYYAMAKDGCFFRGAARVNPVSGAPVAAILYQTIATAAMILIGQIESLVVYIGFALVFFAAMATAGLIPMRRRRDWKKLSAVSWGYPLAPLVFIAASAWMLFYTAILRPAESGLGLLTILLGAGLYWWRFRRREPSVASAE